MCGIYGIIGPNAQKYKGSLKIFDNFLMHRGPDHGNVFIDNNLIIGHRRLSILDLSKKSNQPLISKNKENVISYNGEIYNSNEILNELNYKIKNASDSIALVEILSKKGISSLNNLRGMFAFCYYNKKNKNCYLVRDRFGIKPLYYLKHDNCIFFSSEIKPLLFFCDRKSYNRKIIDHYLNFSVLDHSKETFFKNIYQLEPGHYLQINKEGQIKKKVKWYDLKKSLTREKYRKINHDFVDEFYQEFSNTIRLHLRSDVELGLSLSGGIDSKIILEEVLKNHHIKNLKSFSFLFNEKNFSEKNQIIENIGNKKIKSNFITLNENLLSEFSKNIFIQEQPFGGVATMAMSHVYQNASENNVKVMLNGSGADDYLSGSNRELFLNLIELKNKKSLNYEFELISYCKMYNINKKNVINKMKIIEKGKLLSADGTESVNTTFLRKILKLRKKKNITLKSSLIDRMLINKIPRNLRYEDRNSMFHSIETRVPFLDHKLVELGLSLPNEYLASGALGKIILRKILFKNFFYKQSFKIKHAVQTPQSDWLKLKSNINIIIEILLRNRVFLDDFINVKKIINFLNNKNYQLTNNTNFVWQWISLAIWHENFFEK